jgi:hypothetical protein
LAAIKAVCPQVRDVCVFVCVCGGGGGRQNASAYLRCSVYLYSFVRLAGLNPRAQLVSRVNSAQPPLLWFAPAAAVRGGAWLRPGAPGAARPAVHRAGAGRSGG